MNFRHVNRLSAPSPALTPCCRFFKQFMTLCRLAFSCKIWITKRISNWQNPKRIKWRGGGGVGSSRVFGLGRGGKWADRQLGKRGWDSHTLRVTLTRAGQVPCSCFPKLYLPYLPLPCTTQSQLYLYTVIYSHVCASLTVRVCICVCLRWQRALLYALRRIAHKTFLLLI